MVPGAHKSQPPKRHLDRFSRFRTVHACDQHTDRHTDHTTCDIVAIGRVSCTDIFTRKQAIEMETTEVVVVIVTNSPL